MPRMQRIRTLTERPSERLLPRYSTFLFYDQ